jgi:ribosome assembly protein YihI (activator of Der GTPase)
MKVTKYQEPPVEVPPATYTIELTQAEADVLRDLLGWNVTIPAALKKAGERNLDAIQKLMDDLGDNLRRA